MSLFALDKWARFFKIVRQHGGPIRAVLKLWRMDTLKDGTYVGKDSFGNRYFENPGYMIGRSRWVEFSPRVKFEYDGSQITPEWFGWLHYKTDRIPSEDWAKYCLNCCCWCHCWLLPHEENLTGTEKAYVPYSTVPAKISPWDGTSNYDKGCCK